MFSWGKGNDCNDSYAVGLVGRTRSDVVLPVVTDDHRRVPLLVLAAKRGWVETVQALLHARASPNDGDGLWHRTPIWEAASFGHVALLKLLLAAGADPNQTPTGGPSKGFTPLEMARQQRRWDAEAWLRQNV